MKRKESVLRQQEEILIPFLPYHLTSSFFLLFCFLLPRSIFFSPQDLEENTIIAVAAYKGRTDVIELYCQNPNLDVPSLLDHSDSNGKTALHLAALKGNADVVRVSVQAAWLALSAIFLDQHLNDFEIFPS